jgi:RND family efflux transporter MFP subunit
VSPAGRWRFGLLVLAAVALGGACTGSSEVATYTVKPRPFVHRVTAEGTLVASTATIIAVPNEVRGRARIAWLADDGNRVEEGAVVARFDDANMRLELSEGRADLRSSELRRDKADATGEARRTSTVKDLRVAELELEAAERYSKSDEDLYSRHEIIESQIDGELARVRQEHSSRLVEIQDHLDGTELDLIAIERNRARRRLEEAELGLLALEVRAPRSGILVWQRDGRGEPLRVGQEVFRGQPLGEIPHTTTMKVVVYVLEADAGGLAAGKPARVRIEAHPEHWYEGQITTVEPVAQPRYRGSPVQYFGVELELAHTDTERMRPGQRARASLLLAERQSALVVPRQAVFIDRAKSYVWLRTGARWEERNVRLGPQSTGLAVIDEGLADGDVVALEDPRRSVEDNEPVPTDDPASADRPASPPT